MAQYQIQDALASYREAYSLRPKVIEIKSAYQMLYLFDSTRNKIEKCQNINEKIKLVEKLGDICVKLYERFGFKRLLIGALSRYLEQLELAKNVKNYELSEIHSSIAVTQTDLEDIDSAIEHYRFAISEAKTPKKQLRLVYEFDADIIEKKTYPIFQSIRICENTK